MTAGSHLKMLNQLANKPAKLKKYEKFNVPKKRTTGINLRKCRLCGRVTGHMCSYGLHLCRQCFRDKAKDLGFKKYR